MSIWIRETSIAQRRTLLTGFVGFGLDGFDFMIYTFIIPTLLAEWGMSKAQAGYIATATLLTAAAGGWVAGILADRYGRVRLLQVTVTWFAVFTFLSGFTHSFGELLATRALQGFGFGGEWSVGSLLIAETIDARHRGRASGLIQSSWAVGWALAAIAFWAAYALVAPRLGWKILFWSGILPAFLVLYIRRHVEDAPVYRETRAAMRRTGSTAHFLDIFKPPLLRTTVLASLLCCGMLAAYYSVSTWLPTYLKLERHLSVAGTSSYLLVLIAGSFAGYFASAWASDALGRRACFILFAFGGMVMVLAYTGLPLTDGAMLVLGFPLGFFTSGVFAGMGAYLTELYPNAVRGSGQGFCYNAGRALSALCPALVGLWSAHATLGVTICGMTVAAYVLTIAAALALPETRGRVLTAPSVA